MRPLPSPQQICSQFKDAAAEGPFLIAIDGRCGSDKNTLGQRLAELPEANLFHADDFYLRPRQRTPERYQEPGGSMDRERLLREVLAPSEIRPFLRLPPLRLPSGAVSALQPPHFPERRSQSPKGAHYPTQLPGTPARFPKPPDSPEELDFRSLHPDRFCDLLLHT